MIRLAIALLALAALAVLPRFVSEYELGLLIGMASYVALASAWALFSGHTHYISLATVAFYGTGAYTVAVLQVQFGINPWIGLAAGGLAAGGGTGRRG